MSYTHKGEGRSVNGRIANERGRLTASQLARETGIPVGFIKSHCQFASNGEWHHTGAFANAVDYFQLEKVEAWRDDPEGDFAERLAKWKADQKAARKAAKDTPTYHGVTAWWLEWNGIRQFRKCIERREKNCTAKKVSPTMWEVILPDGETIRKRESTNGFFLRHNGKRLV